MTTYTYDERIVSDLHKDAYGFRPGEGFRIRWAEASEDGKQAIWDDLCETLDRELAREQEAQTMAIEDFEARVSQALSLGAKSRRMAIRWLLDAEGLDPSFNGLPYALEELEYQLGLPYNYFRDEA